MRRRYVISGRVQGVGYRQFACDTARLMRISGWVRNLPSGEVEAEAQADAEQLADYERRLRRGPQLARVENLAAQDLPDEPGETKLFEIRR